MSSTRILGLVSVFLALCAGHCAQANDLDRYVVGVLRFPVSKQGRHDHAREVVPCRPDFRLSAAGKSIKPRELSSIYIIEQSEPDRLLIKEDADNPARGWVAAKDVVPLQKAESFFTAAIQADGRAELPLLMRGMVRFHLRQYDRALADLDQVLRLRARSFEALEWRSLIELKKGNSESALAYLDRAIQLNPSGLRLLQRRAALYAGLHKPELALADLDRAIKLDPSDPHIWLRRATVNMQSFKHKEALVDLANANKLNAEDPLVFEADLVCLIHARRYDLARKAIDKRLIVHPDRETTYTCLVATALLDFEQRRYFSALSDLDRAIALDPVKADAYLVKSAILVNFGLTRKALESMNAAIRANPEEPSSYLARSVARYQRREYSGALADLETALRLNPDEAEAHERRALLLATCPEPKIRNGREAVAAALRACELSDWAPPRFVAALAAAEAEAGDFPAAVTYQEKAIKLVSKSSIELDEYRLDLDRYKAKKPSYRLSLLEEWGIRR
jgi:serine/threonine-protein kinase